MTHTIGDNRAYRHSAVSHKPSETLQRSRFHLIVGHLAAIEPEFLDALVKPRIRKRQTKLTPCGP